MREVIDVEFVVLAVLGRCLILVWVRLIFHLLRVGDHDPTRTIGLVVLPFSPWRDMNPYGSA
jgi:hypothetical protein